MKRLLMLVGATLVLALPASGSAATVPVKITTTGFQPSPLTVSSGDAVQWTDGTGALRQIVADEGSFASPILKPGQDFSFTFRTAGTYAYHDGLHPSLKGTLTVKGPPAEVTLDVGAPILVYGHSTTLT